MSGRNASSLYLLDLENETQKLLKKLDIVSPPASDCEDEISMRKSSSHKITSKAIANKKNNVNKLF